jgi:NIMA (never in mitosis gene a)-related kinase
MGKLTMAEQSNAVNEVRMLASIEHPNVISYKESFFDD